MTDDRLLRDVFEEYKEGHSRVHNRDAEAVKVLEKHVEDKATDHRVAHEDKHDAAQRALDKESQRLDMVQDTLGQSGQNRGSYVKKDTLDAVLKPLAEAAIESKGVFLSKEEFASHNRELETKRRGLLYFIGAQTLVLIALLYQVFENARNVSG